MIPSPDRPLLIGRRLAFAAMLSSLAVFACLVPPTLASDPPGEDRNADAVGPDPLGETVTSVRYLKQHWSPEDSQRFYFTSQGSQLLPYKWFLVLESPTSETPFRARENILRYRYLPQKPDAWNPDGLPVGFVKDRSLLDGTTNWLGFTCAACHTNELHFNNVAYRVDGAPALSDVVSFLRDLEASLVATRDNAAKFDRFAKAVLGAGDSPEAREELKAELEQVILVRHGYNARNFPKNGGSAYGRIDAFGAILNEVFHRATPNAKPDGMEGSQTADAPVSIPFLWDAPQHDRVQWNGAAPNGGPGDIGSLGRNVGEVLGVFGQFQFNDLLVTPLGYESSVQINNLRRMENWLKTLWSPQWPDAFPPIDVAKRDAGKVIYQRKCANCHDKAGFPFDRTSPNRKITAVLFDTGTDPKLAENFARERPSGRLEGKWSKYVLLLGDRIPDRTTGDLMLSNAVIGTIFRWPLTELRNHLLDPSLVQINLKSRDLLKSISFKNPKFAELFDLHRSEIPDLPPETRTTARYKARPLNGIWATAPYLHNGSVPSLTDLLTEPAKRPIRFTIGTRQFDPIRVGFRQDAPGFPTFEVKDAAGKDIPGNSNVGHYYAEGLTGDQKAALLEYLKSI